MDIFSIIGKAVLFGIVGGVSASLLAAFVEDYKLRREVKKDEEYRKTHGKYLKSGAWVHESLIKEWADKGIQVE